MSVIFTQNLLLCHLWNQSRWEAGIKIAVLLCKKIFRRNGFAALPINHAKSYHENVQWRKYTLGNQNTWEFTKYKNSYRIVKESISKDIFINDNSLNTGMKRCITVGRAVTLKLQAEEQMLIWIGQLYQYCRIFEQLGNQSVMRRMFGFLPDLAPPIWRKNSKDNFCSTCVLV